jgi:hypothetical protein
MRKVSSKSNLHPKLIKTNTRKTRQNTSKKSKKQMEFVLAKQAKKDHQSLTLTNVFESKYWQK